MSTFNEAEMNTFDESSETVKIVIGSNSESLRNMFPGGPGCTLFAGLIDNVNHLWQAVCCGLFTIGEVCNESTAWKSFCNWTESPVPADLASLVMSWIHRKTPVDDLHVMAIKLLVGEKLNVVVIGRT